jgi:hypothetical protein
MTPSSPPWTFEGESRDMSGGVFWGSDIFTKSEFIMTVLGRLRYVKQRPVHSLTL